MTIGIKDIKGNVKAEIAINEGAKGKYTLGSEDYITLPFNVAEPIAFSIGDYVELTEDMVDYRFAKRYMVTEMPSPTPDSDTGGYHYDLRLNAYYYAWANLIVKYMPENGGGKETAFSIVSTIDTHFNIIAKTLAEAGVAYNDEAITCATDSTIEPKASKLVTYNGTNVIDALTAIAKEWECEWWVDGSVVNFGRMEHGDTITLTMDGNVSDMTKSDSEGTYATRLYVFGSERNIHRNYRKNDNEELVVGGVVTKRLMIPADKGSYIDAYRYNADGSKVYVGEDGYDDPTNTEMPAQEAIEAVITTDEIYPRTKLTITDIFSYKKEIKDEKTDKGTGEYETFYQFTVNGWKMQKSQGSDGKEYISRIVEDETVADADRFYFSKDFLLGELGMKFIGRADNDTSKNCLLNGMTFDVNATETGFPQLYEINANNTYKQRLPNDTLFPQVGDEFVLFGYDASKVDEGTFNCHICHNTLVAAPDVCPVCGGIHTYDGYAGRMNLIPTAERDLYDWGVGQLQRILRNEGTYSVTLMSDYAAGENAAEDENRAFSIGQRVSLVSGAFFATPKQSRIIGYEICLDIPYDNPVYTVGESVEYSRIADIEGSIEELALNGKSYIGTGGGTGVYLITTNDSTTPTDTNAFSARRADNRFIRRDINDSTEHHLSVGSLLVGGEVTEGGEADDVTETEGNALMEAGVASAEPTPQPTGDLSGHTWGELQNVSATVDNMGGGTYNVAVSGGVVSLRAIEGKTFAGVVSGEGFQPISATANCYYLVAKAGTYAGFGGMTVGAERCALFVSDGAGYDMVETDIPQSAYVDGEIADIRGWMAEVSEDIDVAGICQRILGVGAGTQTPTWASDMAARLAAVETRLEGIGTIAGADAGSIAEEALND